MFHDGVTNTSNEYMMSGFAVFISYTNCRPTVLKTDW